MSAFDKIIGYDKIKTELMQISDMIHRPDAYAALGARMPKGLLLDGEPGLGKTLMAMALMEDSGLPCFTVRRCRSEEGFLKTLEETFGKAADAAPSMILLDDMDKFSSDEFSTAEFTAVQGCMDKVWDKPVFVIATVNDADTLPDSLLRCGRFDRQIIVHRPDTEDAEEIIRHYLERQVAAPDIAISDLAMLLVHSSCAELESALNEAAVYAAYDRSSTISAAHFIRAVLTTVHHVSPDISDADKEDQEASARHEAGHIAVMELLAPGSVAFATLCSKRPRDCSGFILRNSRLDMETNVMTLLAGKSACELHYGKVAIGCGDDLSKAAAQIRRWVETLGSNCVARTAVPEFEAVKKQFRKTEGRGYYHIVQAFAPDDPLDFTTAHELGVKLAEHFVGYQCIVVTHMNTAHIHNHIIMNSVNFETGMKFHQSAREMQQVKDYCSQLCQEYGLSVTESKANPFRIPTWKRRLTDHIKEAMEQSRTRQEFIAYMNAYGYDVKWEPDQKYITYTTPENIRCRDSKLFDQTLTRENMELYFRLGGADYLQACRRSPATTASRHPHWRMPSAAWRVQWPPSAPSARTRTARSATLPVSCITAASCCRSWWSGISPAVRNRKITRKNMSSITVSI